MASQTSISSGVSTSESTGSTEMNTFKSFVTVLADNAKDDIKLKAAQELMKNFEVSYAANYIDHHILKKMLF